jgi:putative hemolysin
MMHLWQGLADYVARHEIEILFGVASFHGTDIADIAPALSLLHHKHRATQSLRPHAIGADAIDMNILPYESIDRKSAMLKVPALIKAYLRLGGMVGQGAFVDHAFNTTDVCLVLDMAQMNEKQRQIYDRA